MSDENERVTVVGAGLAGCEAAYQLAERGFLVRLLEMKPELRSPAHRSPWLCEVVCSNSLRSDDPSTPAGMLKAELRRGRSLVLAVADRCRVPAGEALAVDREEFSREVTTLIEGHPRIAVEHVLVTEVPAGQAIVATGPLTHGPLVDDLRRLCQAGSAAKDGAGSQTVASIPETLYFYDAIAPIVDAESLNMSRIFCASRFGRGGASAPGERSMPSLAAAANVRAGLGAETPVAGVTTPTDGDYLNCPLSPQQYLAFVEELRRAQQVTPHAFEEARYFEGCLPIEVMAERGLDVLAHGPMRPVGLFDPRSGSRPHAVVQLRPENRYRTSYNLVGFQTRLTYGEQKRVFRLIPGLEHAEFLRFGSIHRNLYVDAPRVLGPGLELRGRPDVRLAGQITGVEGYLESCASGWLAAVMLAARLRGRELAPPPPQTAIGALHLHVTRPRGAGERFAPSNIHFGLLPPLRLRAHRRERRFLYAERGRHAFEEYLRDGPLL